MIAFTQETTYNPIDAWSCWTALCLHFNPERDYDAIKYKFKGPKCNPAKFAANKQKFLYEKLVKKYPNKNDFIGYAVANLIAGKSWINDTTDDIYNKWVGKIQALDYNFIQDIKTWGACAMKEDLKFDDCLIPKDINELPLIYKLYKEDKLSLESISIIEILTRFVEPLSAKLNDPLNLAADISHKINKYSPFLVEAMNVKKYTEAIIETFNHE